MSSMCIDCVRPLGPPVWQAEADNIRLLNFSWPTGVNHTVQINICQGGVAGVAAAPPIFRITFLKFHFLIILKKLYNLEEFAGNIQH